jgi:hypothetical protein
VVEARKEVALTSKLSHNLSMGEERVDLLLRISYNEKIYDLPIEIETQEGNMFQIEKNIGKCVEIFGGMLVIPKSSMIPSIKRLLKEIPIKYSKRTMVLSYSLMQTKNNTSDRLIKEAIEQLLPALSST